MTISVTGQGIVVSSFTTKPVLSVGPDEVQLARRNPNGVIYNLLNRADMAERAGDSQRASELRARAEELFDLVS